MQYDEPISVKPPTVSSSFINLYRNHPENIPQFSGAVIPFDHAEIPLECRPIEL